MKMTLLSVLGFLTPNLALAQEQDVNVNQVIDLIVQGFQQGKMVGVAAGVVLILVFIFRKYILPKLKLGTGVLPLVTLSTGALIGFLSLYVSGTSAQEAANISFLSGPFAMAMYDSVIKLVLKKE